jgi:hypothetical protein
MSEGIPNPSTGMMNEDVLIIIGVTVVFIIMVVVVYYLYDKYVEDAEVDEDYKTSNNDLKIQMNADTNKAIVNYLNTLNVVQGTDLTSLETSMKAFVTNLVDTQARRITANKDKIDTNKNDITVNRIQRVKNKSDIEQLGDDIMFLRKGISYDTAKIIITFIKEYENKYAMTSSQKNMLMNTKLFGLFDDEIFHLFDKDTDKPDLFVNEYKDALLFITNMLFTEFNIMNYYTKLDELEYSSYNSLKPYVYTYIETHKDKINFDNKNKLSFIVTEYIPKLITYIINNKIQIFDDIDTLMIRYFESVPKTTYFNEFLTTVEITNVIDDNEHLFTKCMQKVTEGLYNNWNKFKTKVLKNKTMFSSHESKLLFVLIPEYLMMLKYNSDNLGKYNKYIDSQYFLNMPSNYLNRLNIVNFHSILRFFKCNSVHTNIRNEALKIFLSDNLSSLCTQKHTKFINGFLEKYRDVVNNNIAVIGNVNDYLFDYTDFVCDASADFDIDAHCSTNRFV